MNTRDSYQPQMVAAARQVLLELAFLLEDERDHVVFVGGTACALLFPQEIDPHEGTIDVDIALDPVRLAEYGTDTLEEKLIYANFQQDALKAGEELRALKKYRWFRSALIAGSGSAVEVAVDLLCGEYDDSQRHTGARETQGLHPSVLRGLDLAFLDPRLVLLSGHLPDGSQYQTEVQVCSPASLLAMKGIAIADRQHGQDKDAFDIDYILRRFDGGPDTLARVLQTDVYWCHGLVQEGLTGIAQTFHTLNAIGPTSIASEDRYPDPEERAIVQQGAFQRVQRLLKTLNISI
jgi:hypothetical protein